MNWAEDERRTLSEEQVRDMLEERQRLLALLFQTSAAGGQVTEPEDILLEDFCRTLVDYIAAGHACLYERIAGKRERRQPVADQIPDAYPRIEQTTDMALQFNDRYANGMEDNDHEMLKRDLSRLAEALTMRMELEDRLIESLLGKK